MTNVQDHPGIPFDDQPQFFFVVGQARSGTNWTCALLNLHPKVNCNGEYHFERLLEGVNHFTGNANALGAHEPLREMAWQWFQGFVRASMRRQRDEKPEAIWLGDRTPRELEPLVPDSPHFLVIRDGRDVIVSRAHHQMRMGGPWGEPFEHTMAEDAEAFRDDPGYFQRHPDRLFADPEYLRVLVQSWVRRMERDLETARRMETGDISGRVRTVRYERLHDDLEAERSAMYRFLGLDPADADPVSNESHTTAGFDAEDPHALRRRGRVGDWIEYATDDFRQIVKDHAGEMLVRLEYEQNLNW